MKNLKILFGAAVLSLFAGTVTAQTVKNNNDLHGNLAVENSIEKERMVFEMIEMYELQNQKKIQKHTLYVRSNEVPPRDRCIKADKEPDEISE